MENKLPLRYKTWEKKKKTNGNDIEVPIYCLKTFYFSLESLGTWCTYIKVI